MKRKFLLILFLLGINNLIKTAGLEVQQDNESKFQNFVKRLKDRIPHLQSEISKVPFLSEFLNTQIKEREEEALKSGYTNNDLTKIKEEAINVCILHKLSNSSTIELRLITLHDEFFKVVQEFKRNMRDRETEIDQIIQDELLMVFNLLPSVQKHINNEVYLLALMRNIFEKILPK